MPSQYTVLSFMNMITGESVNVAVAALDDKVVKFSVLKNWTRFNAMFGAQDPILDFILNDYLTVAVTPENLKKRISRQSGMSSLQFSELRGSLTDVDELLDYVTKTFLVE
jgi:hypothetical protein